MGSLLHRPSTGVIALLQDRAAVASTHARSILRGKRSIGDRYGLALGFDLLAAALAAEGAIEQAAAARHMQARYERAAHAVLGEERHEGLMARSDRKGCSRISWGR